MFFLCHLFWPNTNSYYVSKDIVFILSKTRGQNQVEYVKGTMSHPAEARQGVSCHLQIRKQFLYLWTHGVGRLSLGKHLHQILDHPPSIRKITSFLKKGKNTKTWMAFVFIPSWELNYYIMVTFYFFFRELRMNTFLVLK